MEDVVMITFMRVNSTVSLSKLLFVFTRFITSYANTLPNDTLWITSQFKVIILSYTVRKSWIFRSGVGRVYWYHILNHSNRKDIDLNLETSLKWATAWQKWRIKYKLRMINSMFILNWKALQKQEKSKIIEAFRCGTSIWSQLNGLVTYCIEVSISIAFTLSKRISNPLHAPSSLFASACLGLSKSLCSWDCFSHSETRTTIYVKDIGPIGPTRCWAPVFFLFL